MSVEMSEKASAMIAKPCDRSEIRSACGGIIRRGDRVVVRWAPGHPANGCSLGRGYFLGCDRYGGIWVEFDEPKRHDSQISGVTYTRLHYICSLGSVPRRCETYYLDGFPCKGNDEFLMLEVSYDQRQSA